MTKRKYAIGIAIIVIAMVFLIYTGLDSSMMSYLDVRDIPKSVDVKKSSVVQITGIVRPGSVTSDLSSQRVKFVLQDMNSETSTIKVSYSGLLPDNFNPGLQVVIQGTVQNGELVIADQILTKCPSKYEESYD